MLKIRICGIVILFVTSLLCFYNNANAQDMYSCDLTVNMCNEIENSVKNDCKKGNEYMIHRAYIENRFDVDKYVNNDKIELNKCIKAKVVKVPFQSDDGTYGVAVFAKNKNTLKYEFLGEKYDCINDPELSKKNENDIENIIKNKDEQCQDIQYYALEEFDLTLVSVLVDGEYQYTYHYNNEKLLKKDGKVELMTNRKVHQLIGNLLEKQPIKNVNNLSGGMAFENQKKKNISIILIILIFICILLEIIFFIKKCKVKLFYVVNIVVIAGLLFFLGYYYHNYGIKEITYPMIQGKNQVQDSKEMQKIMNVLDLDTLKEIPYKKSLDPGQKSGGTDVLKIIMNNNKEMYIVSDEDYTVVRSGKEVHLYQKNSNN